MRAQKLEIKQFKHDIASPIAALATVAKMNEGLSQCERDIMKMSIDRVEGLVSSLSSKEESIRLENIYELTNQIVKEKMINNKFKLSLRFSNRSKEAMCHIQNTEFKRMLSNILNNSLEALSSDGVIKIKAEIIGRHLKLSIIDNGHGITRENINQITNLGWSHRKIDGQGLGLYHAKKTIEKWRGSLKINSVFNLGTKITLHLPIGHSPLSIAA
jgi:signal transduction histidine kinase